jgi:excisionase family DNA binding protein
MTESAQSTLLTRPEAAAWLHVSESTIQRMTRDGDLLRLKVRGRTFWDLADLQTWVKRNKRRG